MKLLFCGCCAFTFDQACGWNCLHSHSLTHQFSPPSQPSAALVLFPPWNILSSTIIWTEFFFSFTWKMHVFTQFIYWVNNQISPDRLKRDLHQHTHALNNTHPHIPPPSALSLWLTECCSTVWTSKEGWLYIHSRFNPCALNSSASSKRKKNRH